MEKVSLSEISFAGIHPTLNYFSVEHGGKAVLARWQRRQNLNALKIVEMEVRVE